MHPWRFEPPSIIEPDPPMLAPGDIPAARVVLRWRLWKPDHSGFISMWWEPDSSIRRRIQDLDVDHLQQAEDFLKVLRTPVRRGRPPGIRTLTPDEFRDRLRQICRDWMASDHRRYPTQDEAAVEIKISHSTFRRYLRQYAVTWPPSDEFLNTF